MQKYLLFALLFFTAGCLKTNMYNFSSDGGPGQVVIVWQHSVILGIIPLGEIDVARACGDNGVWSVSTRQNVINAILSGLTSGIYTPTVARITCKS